MIFYHFHQFQLLDNGKYDRLSTFYTANCPEPAMVYEVYESALDNCLVEVRFIEPEFRAGLKSVRGVRSRRIMQSYAPMWAKDFLRKFLRY